MKLTWRIASPGLGARSQPSQPAWLPPGATEPERVWLPGRVLLWCAGVDRTVLRTRLEALRYAGLGALVAAVAMLGAFTFTIFASVVVGQFRWYLLATGVFWGLLILLVDRAIVTEPHYRFREARAALRGVKDEKAERDKAQVKQVDDGQQVDGQQVDGQLTSPLAGLPLASPQVTGANGSVAANGVSSVNGSAPARDPAAEERPPARLDSMNLPPDRTGWHVRGLVYLMRLLITCCIAYLVAEAGMLLIFHQEVKQQLTQIHAIQFQQERTGLINQAINQEKDQLSVLRGNWATAEKNVKSDQQQLTADQNKAANEQQGVLTGGTSGIPGAGQQWNLDKGIVTDDENTLRAAQKDAANAELAYKNLNSELQLASEANPTALAELNVSGSTIAMLKQSVYGNNGLDAQEHAFDTFVAQDRGDVLVVVGPWVIRVLLISIDLVPLGTKLLNRYTLYGRRVSQRALLIRYADQVRDTAMLRDIDQQATIRALHRQHDFEVEIERMGWRRTWKMGHLNPGEAQEWRRWNGTTTPS